MENQSVLKKEVLQDRQTAAPQGIFPNPADPLNPFNPNTGVPPVDPMQPFTPTPFPKDPDENADKAREEIISGAAVFGQSEEEMNKEFRAFKAAKLFKKFDYDLTGVCGEDEFRSSIDGAITYGFGSVVVTPQWIVRAKEKLKDKGVKVAAAVTFPYGEESFGVKTYAAKKAVRAGAEEVFVPCGKSQIKKGNYDALKKEFKKLKKASKKASVYAVLDCGGLTSSEIEKTVGTLVKAGVRNFVATGSTELGELPVKAEGIKNGGKFAVNLTCSTRSVNGKEVASLLAVSDRVFLKTAVAVARDIKESLKIS